MPAPFILDRLVLDKAIFDLTRAVNDDPRNENLFQSVLENNSCILREIRMVRSIPHPVLNNPIGDTFIPDFVCQDDRGLWHVVEIKPASARIHLRSKGNRRNRPYADLNEWIAQAAEYSSWLSQQPARQQFETTYDTELHDNLSATIIAGRGSLRTNLQLHQTTSRLVPTTSVITYDNLISALITRRKELYGPFDKCTGLTLIVTLIISRPKQRSTIIDVGENTAMNRISVSVSPDFCLAVETTFLSGRIHTFFVESAQHQQSFQAPFTIVFEVMSDETQTRIWLGIGDRELLYAHFPRTDLAISVPAALVLGADMEGKHPTDLVSIMTSLSPKPLDPVSLTTLLEFGSLVSNPDSYCMQFSHGAFLYTEGHPLIDPLKTLRTTNLVQREESKAPILRSLQNMLNSA